MKIVLAKSDTWPNSEIFTYKKIETWWLNVKLSNTTTCYWQPHNLTYCLTATVIHEHLNNSWLMDIIWTHKSSSSHTKRDLESNAPTIHIDRKSWILYKMDVKIILARMIHDSNSLIFIEKMETWWLNVHNHEWSTNLLLTASQLYMLFDHEHPYDSWLMDII